MLLKEPICKNLSIFNGVLTQNTFKSTYKYEIYTQVLDFCKSYLLINNSYKSFRRPTKQLPVQDTISKINLFFTDPVCSLTSR